MFPVGRNTVRLASWIARPNMAGNKPGQKRSLCGLAASSRVLNPQGNKKTYRPLRERQGYVG